MFKKLRREAIRGAVKIFGADAVYNFGNAFAMASPFGPLASAVWTYEFNRAMGASRSEAFSRAVVAGASAWAFSSSGGSSSEGGGFSLPEAFEPTIARYRAARVTIEQSAANSSSSVTGGTFANGAYSAAFASALREGAARSRVASRSEEMLVTGNRNIDPSSIDSAVIVRPVIDYSTAYDSYGEAMRALEIGITDAKAGGHSEWEYGGISVRKDGRYYISNIATSRHERAIVWSLTTIDDIAIHAQITALHHYHPLHGNVMPRAFSRDDIQTFHDFRRYYGEGFRAVYLIDRYGTRKFDGTRRHFRGISCEEGIASC